MRNACSTAPGVEALTVMMMMTREGDGHKEVTVLHLHGCGCSMLHLDQSTPGYGRSYDRMRAIEAMI